MTISGYARCARTRTLTRILTRTLTLILTLTLTLDPNQVRSLRVFGTHLPNLAAISLEITTNAQQFSADGAQFTYHGGSSFQVRPNPGPNHNAYP